MDKLVADKGKLVKMTLSGTTYLVNRHYIALHGVTGKALPTLGFATV